MLDFLQFIFTISAFDSIKVDRRLLLWAFVDGHQEVSTADDVSDKLKCAAVQSAPQ